MHSLYGRRHHQLNVILVYESRVRHVASPNLLSCVKSVHFHKESKRLSSRNSRLLLCSPEGWARVKDRERPEKIGQFGKSRPWVKGPEGVGGRGRPWWQGGAVGWGQCLSVLPPHGQFPHDQRGAPPLSLWCHSMGH